MLQITPKIVSVFKENRVCDYEGFIVKLQRHEAIFEAIQNKDVAKAIESMKVHFGM